MLILSVVQVSFAAVAVTCCAAAGMAAVRRSAALGFYLMLAGGFGFVFFMAVPNAALQMPLVALVAIAAGVVLAPQPEPIVRPADFEIGESTATRRK